MPPPHPSSIVVHHHILPTLSGDKLHTVCGWWPQQSSARRGGGDCSNTTGYKHDAIPVAHHPGIGRIIMHYPAGSMYKDPAGCTVQYALLNGRPLIDGRANSAGLLPVHVDGRSSKQQRALAGGALAGDAATGHQPARLRGRYITAGRQWHVDPNMPRRQPSVCRALDWAQAATDVRRWPDSIASDQQQIE